MSAWLGALPLFPCGWCSNDTSPAGRLRGDGWTGLSGAGTDSRAAATPAPSVRPLPAPTLGGPLSCSPTMWPFCAGSLLPFQTALARGGRPPLGQLAFPERGNSSRALLCPAWPLKQPAVWPGQRRVGKQTRESTVLLRGWDRGRKAMPTAGPSLEAGRMGRGSCLSCSSGLAQSGRSWAGPTHGSVRGDQSPVSPRWVAPDQGRWPPPPCPHWALLAGDLPPCPTHTFPLSRPDCQSSRNSQLRPTPGLWNRCSLPGMPLPCRFS